MIVVIDYQTGNIGAIENMLKKIGAEAFVSSDLKDIERAQKLILPGVGSFDAGIDNLKKLNLVSVLTDKVIRQKTPILGICLGMQLFAEKSEEGGSAGLGWIEGRVVRFRFADNPPAGGLKIPQMGWNTLKIKKEDNLLKDLPRDPRFYFAHSYHFDCEDKNNVLALTNYGYDFESVIKKNNIMGVQFHPEKSHKFGMKLLKNFAESC